MRIAVIGAGLFGCTTAIHLARAGHDVHLIEQANRILSGASTINQMRLHSGFHYPRSFDTIRECQAGLASFREEYATSIVDDGIQYYAIAAKGSKIPAATFRAVCKTHGLPFLPGCGFINDDAVEDAYLVQEARIDPETLVLDVTRKLQQEGVHLRLNTAATDTLRAAFDKIVIAAYAGSNRVASELGCPIEQYQFEVCEKPVIRLDAALRDISIVVMDGEFCSLDPWGATGLHVMGHVKHAIHATNTGHEPMVPPGLASYLNRGVVPAPTQTRFDAFIEAGKVFIPALEGAEYVGSMFTVRTVLPNRDFDDARPTMVTELDRQVVRVFSGKLGCAVTAAQSLVEMFAPSLNSRGDLSLSAA